MTGNNALFAAHTEQGHFWLPYPFLGSVSSSFQLPFGALFVEIKSGALDAGQAPGQCPGVGAQFKGQGIGERALPAHGSPGPEHKTGALAVAEAFEPHPAVAVKGDAVAEFV